MYDEYLDLSWIIIETDYICGNKFYIIKEKPCWVEVARFSNPKDCFRYVLQRIEDKER